MNKQSYDFTGQVAIVTGSTKGLGYGMAKLLATNGADLVVNSRSCDDCEKVAEELRNTGRKVLAFSADVSKREQVEKMIDKTMEVFGRIDILVNNAGVGITKSSLDVTQEEWDEVMNIVNALASRKKIVGADVVELSPRPGLTYADFTAAKLAYRVIARSFFKG